MKSVKNTIITLAILGGLLGTSATHSVTRFMRGVSWMYSRATQLLRSPRLTSAIPVRSIHTPRVMVKPMIFSRVFVKPQVQYRTPRLLSTKALFSTFVTAGVVLNENNKQTQDTSRTYVMRDATSIYNCLDHFGDYKYFMEKTSLVEQLANKELTALGVAAVLELALIDFAQVVQDPKMAAGMQMRKNNLLLLLLYYHPEALKELEALGIYEPSK